MDEVAVGELDMAFWLAAFGLALLPDDEPPHALTEIATTAMPAAALRAVFVAFIEGPFLYVDCHRSVRERPWSWIRLVGEIQKLSAVIKPTALVVIQEPGAREAEVMATHDTSLRSAHRVARMLPRVVLSAAVGAGLVVDAVIHLQLAADRDGIGSALTEGNVFRIESAAALLAAVLVVALPWRRAAYGIAFVVAVSAFAAVVLYRYLNVGALGPLPNMYEPIWYGDKSVSAIAELIAAVGAGAGLVATALRPRSV